MAGNFQGPGERLERIGPGLVVVPPARKATGGPDSGFPMQGRFRSLRSKFLAINIPLMLIAFGVSVSLYEFISYRRALADLEQRLHSVSAGQSIILGESVFERDRNTVSVLLAAIIADPNLIAIRVIDSDGELMDSYGETELLKEGRLYLKSRINYYSEETGLNRVGELELLMTDRLVADEMKKRVLYEGLLALILLAAAVISAQIANRRTIGVPLERLMRAIHQTQGGGKRRMVAWKSEDEMGELIVAYNDMQLRLVAFEDELQRFHTQLEERVIERTSEANEARLLAEAANRAKGDFLASMSHELRTPLQAIIGFTQILQFDPTVTHSKENRDYLDNILTSGELLLELITQVLDFSQIESGTISLNMGEVEVEGLVNEVTKMVAPRAKAAKLTFSVDNNLRLGVCMWSDRTRLKQVLLNLLTNAIKYNSKQGEVRISMDQPGEAHCRIAVTDTGKGIPPEMRDRVFQPFDRLGFEGGSVEGTGIGLAICKKLLETMGGQIGFESETDRGSTFWILVPMQKPATIDRDDATRGVVVNP